MASNEIIVDCLFNKHIQFLDYSTFTFYLLKLWGKSLPLKKNNNEPAPIYTKKKEKKPIKL